jgi:L-alanine-DL-glutamate epimerase-like enolase superfamily enzyme
MAGIVERGFHSIKIKVGALSFKEEVERLRTLRRTVGDEVEIMVDANCAWNDLTYARRIMRAFEEYRIGWFEEPVLPDNFRGSASWRPCLEPFLGDRSAPAGISRPIEHKAADILQRTAVVGGVSEWMSGYPGSAYDLPVASITHDVHAFDGLWSRTPHGGILPLTLTSWCSTLWSGREAEKVPPVPQRPGLGMDLDEELTLPSRIGSDEALPDHFIHRKNDTSFFLLGAQ